MARLHHRPRAARDQEIYAAFKAGVSQKELARRYEISLTSVRRILFWEKWYEDHRADPPHVFVIREAAS